MGTQGTLANTIAGPLPTMAPMPSASSFTGLITINLDRTNFSVWKAQVMPAIYGANLFGHLDGSIAAPPQHLSEGEGEVKHDVPNPAYAVWHRQDQIVVGALLSHMHINILAQMTSYTSAGAIWKALHALFAAHNRAAINTIRCQLSGTKKHDLSVSEYYQKMKALADSMAVAGHPLTDDEIIGYISAGLGEEFDPLMGSFTIFNQSVTLTDFYGFLLSYEARQALRQNQAPEYNSSANSVNRTGGPSNSRGGGSSGGNSSRPPAPRGGGQGGGHRGSRDGG
jgi:uncharacterized membrane protein YgcG